MRCDDESGFVHGLLFLLTHGEMFFPSCDGGFGTAAAQGTVSEMLRAKAVVK
jgi:hypothetical protein